MRKYTFVLEQTLGHVAHARNIRRALARESEVSATVIDIDYQEGERGLRLPGLGNWSFRASRMARAELRRQLRGGTPDAIFIHTQVAALLANDVMREVPTLISLDATPENFDSQGDAYGHSRGARVIELTKRRLNQRAFAGARALVTWCDWAAVSLVRDYGVRADKIHVIHPGVDTTLFQRDQGPRADGPVRVLFVGGDFMRKGGPELLDAIREIGPGVHLDLVTGSIPSHLPGQVSCEVHRGLTPQSDALVDLYRKADIFVLPTRGDCFPQSIAEAMAAGLPVVATDVGAMSELVFEGVNGLLVPPRDARALAAALRSLVGAPAKRREMGEAGRRLAVREHDADVNNAAIIDLMDSLVEGASMARRSA